MIRPYVIPIVLGRDSIYFFSFWGFFFSESKSPITIGASNNAWNIYLVASPPWLPPVTRDTG